MTGHYLYVSESVEQELTAAAASAHPLETGGILIGVYLNGSPWVTTVVELETGQRGRNHYRIPQGATQPAIRAARRGDPRLGYLGDWHSHPADRSHSPTDLATLGLISIARPRTQNPTSLVVRRTESGYRLHAKRITKGTPRACKILYVGDLQPLNGTPDACDSN